MTHAKKHPPIKQRLQFNFDHAVEQSAEQKTVERVH